MQRILTSFLNKKYEDIEMINFAELCTWTLWPHYFDLFRGKSCASVLSLHAYNLVYYYMWWKL